MADLTGERGLADHQVWRPLRGPMERWPHLTDLFIAAISLIFTLMMWGQDENKGVLSMASLSDVATFLFAFVGNAALLWRRSHPLHVHAVVLCASILVLVGTMNDGVFALLFSLYSLGRYTENSRASLIGMLAAFAFVAIDLFVFSSPDIGSTIAAGMVVGVWYIGRRLRFRGEYLRLLEERAEYLERERSVESERAVAAERTRIAREMHDIVAHQLSLMTVQAGAAKTVSRSDPDAAREAMGAVEKAGRQAVAEMRHLLDVLRPVTTSGDLGPQPGIEDLQALVREVSDVGPRVSLDVSGDWSAVPARLELNIYRIVQEALTNVIRHAGANVTAHVRVDIHSDSVAVRVQDDGNGGDSSSTSGHGIVGMRERVELLDGVLHAGPRTEGGFEVAARIPFEAHEN